MTTNVRITTKALRYVGTCRESVANAIAAFPELEGEGVEPTLEGLQNLYNVLGHRVFRLSSLLNGKNFWDHWYRCDFARMAYKNTIDLAEKVYRKDARYENARAEAVRIYDESILLSLAKAFEGLTNDNLRGVS